MASGTAWLTALVAESRAAKQATAATTSPMACSGWGFMRAAGPSEAAIIRADAQRDEPAHSHAARPLGRPARPRALRARAGRLLRHRARRAARGAQAHALDVVRVPAAARPRAQRDGVGVRPGR